MWYNRFNVYGGQNIRVRHTNGSERVVSPGQTVDNVTEARIEQGKCLTLSTHSGPQCSPRAMIWFDVPARPFQTINAKKTSL